MTEADDDSPDVPADVREALEAADDRQLREIIHDAQARLEAHPPLDEEIELAESETFVRDGIEIPAAVGTAIETGDDSRRKAIVRLARRHLGDRPRLSDVVESREDEALVRMEDNGAYTAVIVERPDAAGEARGPFAYMVQWEPHIDDDGGKYRWHYLGRVLDEERSDAGT